jgi:hypothetical protein
MGRDNRRWQEWYEGRRLELAMLAGFVWAEHEATIEQLRKLARKERPKGASRRFWASRPLNKAHFAGMRTSAQHVPTSEPEPARPSLRSYRAAKSQ